MYIILFNHSRLYIMFFIAVTFHDFCVFSICKNYVFSSISNTFCLPNMMSECLHKYVLVFCFIMFLIFNVCYCHLRRIFFFPVLCHLCKKYVVYIPLLFPIFILFCAHSLCMFCLNYVGFCAHCNVPVHVAYPPVQAVHFMCTKPMCVLSCQMFLCTLHMFWSTLHVPSCAHYDTNNVTKRSHI